MRDGGRYVISVASELTGLHPQTLRIYERKGLLGPARTSGGSRRYSDADLARLHRISALTGDGVNLKGVRRILELEDEIARLRAEIARVTAEAQREVQAVEQRYRRDLVPLRPGALVPLASPQRARPVGDERRHKVITQRVV